MESLTMKEGIKWDKKMENKYSMMNMDLGL